MRILLHVIQRVIVLGPEEVVLSGSCALGSEED